MTSFKQKIHELEEQHKAAANAEQNGKPNAPTATVRFVTLEEFISVEEPSAEPLLGTPDETIVPVGGDVITYGKAGAGKTTWTLDGVVHLAAGVAWLGFAVPRSIKVGFVENEGPRGKFRLKLKRKLAAWTGPSTKGRIHVLEEPWSRFTFADPVQRAAVADYVNASEIALLVCGPIATLGMMGGGTPDEINAFMALVDEFRVLLNQPIAVWLVHHENRAGQVSGAWERVPDTLVHVATAGNGHTRVYWQKARWSSETHDTKVKLAWADGWSYTLEEEDEPATAERIWDEIAEQALANGGLGWNKVDKEVSGKAELKRETRDRMLRDGIVVNAGSSKNMKLWHRDDPMRPLGDALGDAP